MCELAVRLARRDQVTAGLSEIERALARRPTEPKYHVERAKLLVAAGDNKVARDSLKEALRLDIDEAVGIGLLVDLASTLEARIEALAWVRQQIRGQFTDGTALGAYRAAAEGIEAPEIVSEFLIERKAAQPELLASWTELARQLEFMGRRDEARLVSEEAIHRFPLQIDAHLTRARLLERDGDPQALSAFETAVAISPGSLAPHLELVTALSRRGEHTRAIELLTAALRRDPLSTSLHVSLAEQLWHRGEHRESIERMVIALELDPSVPRHWDLLALLTL